MTRQQLTAIAAGAVARFDVADIDRPIDDTALDSLDLLGLRAALETHLGRPISDDVWLGSRSLAAMIERLP